MGRSIRLGEVFPAGGRGTCLHWILKFQLAGFGAGGRWAEICGLSKATD
jgi:hypothetical protein